MVLVVSVYVRPMNPHVQGLKNLAYNGELLQNKCFEDDTVGSRPPLAD